MFLRSCAMAIAVLTLAGCASGDYYGGGYGPYDYDEPYYGGLAYYPYSYDYDHDNDRYFHPKKGVTCDRKRDVCYDRFGLNYYATDRYLGEREANRAAKKYGDEVFLFSPKKGVTCDRRTKSCTGGNWTDRYANDDRMRQPEKGNFGSIGSAPRYWSLDQENQSRSARPRLQNNDRPSDNQVLPPVLPRAQRFADSDDVSRVRPSARLQSDDAARPAARPRLNSAGDRSNNGGGKACPPLGCR